MTEDPDFRHEFLAAIERIGATNREAGLGALHETADSVGDGKTTSAESEAETAYLLRSFTKVSRPLEIIADASATRRTTPPNAASRAPQSRECCVSIPDGA